MFHFLLSKFLAQQNKIRTNWSDLKLDYGQGLIFFNRANAICRPGLGIKDAIAKTMSGNIDKVLSKKKPESLDSGLVLFHSVVTSLLNFHQTICPFLDHSQSGLFCTRELNPVRLVRFAPHHLT